MEYVIRGRGFIGQNKDVEQSLADIEKTVVLSREGVPVRIRDLGQVQLGPEFRSGAIDLNGTRGSRRHRRDAIRRESAGGDRACPRKDRTDRAQSERREGRAGLRPDRAHQ